MYVRAASGTELATLAQFAANVCPPLTSRAVRVFVQNLNDMCSPLDPDVLATSLQALTNDSKCIQATGVFTSSASDDRRASGTTNGECCAEIDMGWRMLLRRTPPNSGSGQWNVTAAEPGAHKGSNNGLSVDGERENGFATDSLWVLAQYDSTEARHSSTGISYVFLPMSKILFVV